MIDRLLVGSYTTYSTSSPQSLCPVVVVPAASPLVAVAAVRAVSPLVVAAAVPAASSAVAVVAVAINSPSLERRSDASHSFFRSEDHLDQTAHQAERHSARQIDVRMQEVTALSHWLTVGHDERMNHEAYKENEQTQKQ